MGNCGIEFHIVSEREADGRWLAEVSELPGALAYGSTVGKAISRVEALTKRVLAEQKKCARHPSPNTSA